MRRGFTLIQISILLTLASLVLVAILPSLQTSLNAGNATSGKMNNVLTAMRSYLAANGTLPCPADASQPIGSTSYGVAAANSGTGTPGNCTGGTPSANYVDTANNVAVGMMPVRALGLSNDYALDVYGRTLTYAVDTNATSCGWVTSPLTGKITVTDNGSANTSTVALISHGADGHGAWIPLTGATGSAVRLNAGSTDTDQLTNAHVNSSFAPVTPLTNFVNKTPTATFDDIVVYKSPLWSMNSLPAAAPQISTVTPPANGTYTTGQTLSFTLTFNTVVTVNAAGGTPYITFSAITGNVGTGNVARATYQAGSGTASLTFSYTAGVNDIAPTGLTMASSSITLNGGTIMAGAACVMDGFAAPNLTSVLIGGMVYMTNYVGGGGQMFTINGTYVTPSNSGNVGVAVDPSGNIWEVSSNSILELSSSGSLLHTYTTPGSISGWSPSGIAVDSSSNIYVGDIGNAKVDEYQITGGGSALSLVQTFGSTGATANGILDTMGSTSPMGLGVDASNNVWVSDYGYNRIIKFSISGATATTIQQIPTPAICTASSGHSNICPQNSSSGRFYYPNDVKVDPSGNIWVASRGAGYVEEFNAAGTSVTQMFSSCTGGSAFSSPSGIAVAAGYLWVTDYSNNRLVECTVSGATNTWVRNITNSFNGPYFVTYGSYR